MELQWPLILFTTFVAWSCGLYAVQNIAAARCGSKAPQVPALVTSLVLLAIGGVAVLFHLHHWERIFNGFGHITSGITQELIAIVVIAIVMIVQFSFLRRKENTCPIWLNWVAVAMSVILLLTAGHSYMMPSRPAWNSVFEALSLIGGAAALGAGSFALIEALVGEAVFASKVKLVQALTWLNLACVIIYIVACVVSGGSFIDMGYTWNPTRPTSPLPTAAMYSPFAGTAVVSTIAAVVAAVGSVAVSFAGSKLGWKTAGIGIAVFALISAIALRVMFYMVGGSAYLIY